METSASETAAPEAASAPVTPEAALAATRIATLGGPAVTIETPRVTANAEPAKADVKKRKQAQHAKARRRRVRLTTVQGSPQPLDAFGQPAALATARSR